MCVCVFYLASRRYQASEWLRQMDHGASSALPKESSEEDFCLALRNGLILCNVLNKVNPGAVLKVIYIYILLPLYHVHVSLQAKLCWTIFMCSILIIKNLTNKLFQVRDGFFFLTISFMLILIYACMEFKMFS